MWVADMNFPTVPTITQAIAQRIQHPFFGYFSTSDDYYHAIIHWQEQRKMCIRDRSYTGWSSRSCR